MKDIRVMIVDDHALIREGIKKLLDLESGLEIVALASDGLEALNMIDHVKPDIVLMDINMPGMNGIDCLKAMKARHYRTKVIMLTIHEDVEYLTETMQLGANGYVLKDAEVSSLVKAIFKVAQGEVYIHPTLSELSTTEHRKKESEIEQLAEMALTRREFEVLKMISKGHNNKEIASELFISEKTVKNHISNIFKKIKVTDRTQAALFAIKHNITKI